MLQFNAFCLSTSIYRQLRNPHSSAFMCECVQTFDKFLQNEKPEHTLCKCKEVNRLEGFIEEKKDRSVARKPGAGKLAGYPALPY
ncbi:hypothetical protein CUZ56_00379 [Saezia sanguinis]|uniref:Uncharacterized protein n=1 Tax=Saezia sanguinis TaxID=1965230 RepID=A0A433SGP2_9BURK|nr:hypothetical protein CUZ56_00379 [Saezia sanguinis]